MIMMMPLIIMVVTTVVSCNHDVSYGMARGGEGKAVVRHSKTLWPGGHRWARKSLRR